MISLIVTSAAVAKDDCYSCHGQKGMQGYVDKKSFEQSVHGSLSCTKCHSGVASYPHGKVSRVNCGSCHFLGREGAPREKAQEFKLSVHGQAVAAGNTGAPDCQTCHGSHAVYPSSDERSSTYREKIPALCSQCHPQPFEDYSRSIHGKEFLEKKNPGVPTCFDCHMEHRIPRASEEQWKLALISQCGNCHAEEMNTYHKTYHGKVTRLGYTTIAKCSDCHGSHAILPPSDPNSMLSSNNIVATCGACHPGATTSFTKFYAHAEETNREKYPVLYYTYIFMTALLISVFAFFLTHTFLWAYRALKERMEKKGGE
jgi:predicted CXXCH cytochrome family protein